MSIMSVLRSIRSLALALVSPLLEKNPAKTLALGLAVPLVFSMSRGIVLAFAIGVLHQMWGIGVRGWPEATLAIAIVLALPILSALDRVKASEVVLLARALIGRFGVGELASVPSADASTDIAAAPSSSDETREAA